MLSDTERQSIQHTAVTQALDALHADVLSELRLSIREQAKLRSERDTYRQLVSEALALLDENDADHALLSLRDWLRTAHYQLNQK